MVVSLAGQAGVVVAQMSFAPVFFKRPTKDSSLLP